MLNGKHRQPVPGPLCASYAPTLAVLDDLTDIRLAEDTRAHLAECAWCRAQRVTYDRFDEALRLYFAPDAMPFLPLQRMEPAMSDIHDNTLTDTSADGGVRDDDTLHLTLSPPPIPPRPPRRSWRLARGAASLAAVLVISLLSGLIFMSHGRSTPPAAMKTTPTIVPGSNVQLTAIGMSSRNDGWAMGLGGVTTYMLHYTGGRWVEVKTKIRASIEVVKMLSPTDGWAIGSGVYHYDGKSWQQVDVGNQGSFDAISAVSPTDIWIAGTGQLSQLLIVHYDGHTWTLQKTPYLADADVVTIYGIAMVSATEGWAVGTASQVVDSTNNYNNNGNNNGSQTGIVLHYNKGMWQVAQTLPNSDLRTIAMVSATDGWFGGIKQVRDASFPLVGPAWNAPTLWRYTGGRWTEVAVPPQSAVTGDTLSVGQISNITMFSATDGWMFASLFDQPETSDGSVTLSPDVFHLEQGRWVRIKTPAFKGRIGVFMSQVAFASPDEFWGVGESMLRDPSSGSIAAVMPLLVHYKSGIWDVIQS